MSGPTEQMARVGRRLAGTPNAVPLLCITLAVLVANSPALLHLVTTNPLVTTAGLGPASGRVLPGGNVADPNVGYTLQALGHRAALDWFHGHVPWWNPFEGIGAPLAGEMQSGAFFPLTLVLVVHEGVLILQVALELISGGSTYFLVRRLGVGRALATAAGIAFGLCGTFAWLAHAPMRPAAMVPLCVLGVERGLDAAVQGRRGGWRLLAVGIALLILAGFPETTFFGALFVVWWAILRAFGPGRTVWRSFVGRMALGGVIGVGLSAPLIVAFADYLPWADVGAHNGQFAHASLPVHGLSQLVLPYSLGSDLRLPHRQRPAQRDLGHVGKRRWVPHGDRGRRRARRLGRRRGRRTPAPAAARTRGMGASVLAADIRLRSCRQASGLSSTGPRDRLLPLHRPDMGAGCHRARRPRAR